VFVVRVVAPGSGGASGSWRGFVGIVPSFNHQLTQSPERRILEFLAKPSLLGRDYGRKSCR